MIPGKGTEDLGMSPPNTAQRVLSPASTDASAPGTAQSFVPSPPSTAGRGSFSRGSSADGSAGELGSGPVARHSPDILTIEPGAEAEPYYPPLPEPAGAAADSAPGADGAAQAEPAAEPVAQPASEAEASAESGPEPVAAEAGSS